MDLKQFFSGVGCVTNVRYIFSFFIFSLICSICSGQIPIKGRVLDSELKPIVAARVESKLKNLRLYTDVNGDYHIEASVGDTLKFSSIGLSPESRVITALSKDCNIILIDKEVNCLGAIWDEQDYKKAYRQVNRKYNRLYFEANKMKLW